MTNAHHPLPAPRRAIAARLAPAAATALLALASLPAGAAIARWGVLPTHDGSTVYQWHVAQWIARAFDDGNTADLNVDTSVTMFFTQCYGGDWLSSFNAGRFESGPSTGFDRWSFTQSTVASADKPGDLSYYNGYHRSAAQAFAPFGTAGQVHEAGLIGADSRETPQIQGRLDRNIGLPLPGISRSFVLGYAGIPEPLDWLDLSDLHRATDGAIGTQAVFLSGSGTATAGMVGADLRAATAEELRRAIGEIGGQLRAGSFDSFSLFVTDHGGLATVDTTSFMLNPLALRRLVLPLSAGQRDGTQANGGLEFDIVSAQRLTPEALRQLQLSFNGVRLDATTASLVEIPALDPRDGSGDGGTLSAWRIRLDASWANLVRPDRQGEFEQVLEIGNNGAEALSVEWVALSTGPVLRPVGIPAVPEPGTWATMLVGAAVLATRLRARARPAGSRR